MKKPIILLITIQFLMALNSVFAEPMLTRFEKGEFVRLSTAENYAYMDEANMKTLPYGEYLWPTKIPIVHPYNPTIDVLRPDTSPFGEKIPEFTLTAKITPIKATDIQLKKIQGKLQACGIIDIERFIVFQNNPWKTGTVILFRPNSWLHPDASHNSPDYATTVSAYYAPVGGQIIDLGETGISTHHASNNDKSVIFSGNTPEIESMDFDKTHSFYTICIDPSKPRAAITMHVIYSDTDHDKIKNMITNLDPNNQLSLDAFFSKLKDINIDTTKLLDFLAGNIKASD